MTIIRQNFRIAGFALHSRREGVRSKFSVSALMVWQVLQHVLISEVIRNQEQRVFCSRIDGTMA